jgi:hypothetical protein
VATAVRRQMPSVKTAGLENRHMQRPIDARTSVSVSKTVRRETVVYNVLKAV